MQPDAQLPPNAIFLVRISRSVTEAAATMSVDRAEAELNANWADSAVNDPTWTWGEISSEAFPVANVS
jgi:hypothetical protein